MRNSRFVTSLNFALNTGASLKEKLRLAYYAAFKPSLAARGLAQHSAARIVSVRIKTRLGNALTVRVRDNGVGMVTIAEFFARQSTIMPAQLPPLQPRVIYDLGANVGVASLFFSSLSPEATVYGFEPLPENLEVCALNYEQLPQPSQVFPWAVGARSGIAVFDCQNDSRGGRLESSPHDPKLKTTGKLEVQVYSIGDLITQKGLRPPDFMKIDVEGAEMDVLTGLGEHHLAVKWIYIETHGEMLKRDCVRWLEARGFRIWAGTDETAIWGVRG
jgi:FkbM family methyltransferase